MSWRTVGLMESRAEFVALAKLEGSNMTRLCERFGISRKTGYKWLGRFDSGGEKGLKDHSRKPLESPGRTVPGTEQLVAEMRRKHPAWGGRKIRKVLENQGVNDLPAVSTVTGILKRHGLISAEESVKHVPFKRFERAAPNELWQMDFKGHFPTDGGRCHPLTVLDDHSRYAVGLCACANERDETVRENLLAIFRLHGLPQAILADNGSPWGAAGGSGRTALEVWLLRLGVKMYHGRPFHPQTQGKDERFHRTLKAELLGQRFRDLPHAQTCFDVWRPEYNWVRPHEAIGMETPGKRYLLSTRSCPEKLPEPEYDAGVTVRQANGHGVLSWKGQPLDLGNGLAYQRVGFRPHPKSDGSWEILYFCHVVAVLPPDGRPVRV